MFALTMLSGNDPILKNQTQRPILFPLIACVAIGVFACAAFMRTASRHVLSVEVPTALVSSETNLKKAEPLINPRLSSMVVWRATIAKHVHTKQAILERPCLRRSRCLSRVALSNVARRATSLSSFGHTLTVARVDHSAPQAIRTRHRGKKPLNDFAIAKLDVDDIAVEGLPRLQSQLSNHEAKNDLEDDALAIETGLGHVTSFATAGTLNGVPAAALKLSLANGQVLFDAKGVTEMTSLSDPAALRRTFKVSTSASIPFF